MLMLAVQAQSTAEAGEAQRCVWRRARDFPGKKRKVMHLTADLTTMHSNLLRVPVLLPPV